MTCTIDPIYLTNLILCVTILVLSIIGYTRSKDASPLFIGIAFGIFGISHLMNLLGLKDDLTVFLIVIRTIAYLMVVFALYRVAFRR
ncbi:hypothetical protein ACFLWD_02415 [Chloroflexota bacterium]